MPLHMNEDDLDRAVRRFTPPRADTPNRAHVARVVRNLAEWANDNSDGWAHWPKPARAAARAMEAIVSTTHQANEHQETHDLSRQQALLIVRPIRSFLTRHGVDRATADRIMAG